MLVFCHGFAKIIFREILAEKEMPVWMILRVEFCVYYVDFLLQYVEIVVIMWYKLQMCGKGRQEGSCYTA